MCLGCVEFTIEMGLRIRLIISDCVCYVANNKALLLLALGMGRTPTDLVRGKGTGRALQLSQLPAHSTKISCETA